MRRSTWARTTGTTGTSRLPLRNGVTAAPYSPRRSGLFGPRRRAIRRVGPEGPTPPIARLDPTVRGSGPHGLTVHDPAARLAPGSRPPLPAPRIVAIAKRPP